MRIFLTAAASVVALGFSSGLSTPAHAQTAIEGRVDRLEREMRAVQRKVFPGGAGQTVEPQITAPQTTNIPGSPAGTAVADLTARVAALEGQVSSVTGQVEQAQYRLRQLEDAFNAYKRSTDARLKALEETTSTVGGGAPTVTPPVIAPSGNGRPAATKPPAAPGDSDKPASGPTGAARGTALSGVEKPNTGDGAEDGYVYGFRLWQAKLYPEARAALKDVVTKYPSNRRASYAQNLLGRSYLDAGAPSLAAVAFYENYKKMPNGERAPDSLYYLAQSLVKLKKPASEVCKVYGELNDVYGDRIGAELRAQVDAGRAASKCQ